jgi:serine/threonine-protein kinase
LSTTQPDKLGKYEITGLLGRGAMGVVYKAYDPSIAREVAIKAIRKDVLDRDNAEAVIARFRNEAMAAGRLNHPGIIAIYDYGDAGDTAYIAMEYAEGQGLRDYLRARGAVKLTDIALMMTQLLDALDYAHQRGVIHRDIKPANIIITGDGKLKVTDFGIARLDASNLTQTGMIVGTPSYMAPEQYTGLAVDRRADLFSAGVVLYEMITGMKPFSGTSEVIAYQICHAPHTPPSDLDPALPRPLDDVIARALAKKKEDRYASASEFARGLMAAISESQANAGEPTLIATATRFSAGADTTSLPTGWAPEALRALETELTVLIGPVARTLVKRAAAKSFDAPALIEVLVNTLDGHQERQVFANRARMILDQTTVGTGASSANAATVVAVRKIPDEDLELATVRLSQYMGPIAKVMVKKAAAKSRDVRGLYIELANNLTDEIDRAMFLEQAKIK